MNALGYYVKSPLSDPIPLLSKKFQFIIQFCPESLSENMTVSITLPHDVDFRLVWFQHPRFESLKGCIVAERHRCPFSKASSIAVP